MVLSYTFSQSFINQLIAQKSSNQNYVTYEKQSNFIKEFKIPVQERGLRGITPDSEQNVWFYHATSNCSIIMKMSGDSNFTTYGILGDTVVDNAVVNLAGGQLLFDNISNAIWFTDARTNSLGKLNAKSGDIELFSIPTNNSGIMGLVLSPDRKFVWFTEITGNKIGSLDIESKKITEYPTGDNSGPTLLTFDSKGVLWVTLSYANSILRVEPWLLIPGSTTTGMYSVSLEKPDFFSPFGIETVLVKGVEKIFVSDHGSSRVIAANIDSELKNYTSYWTSPSTALPMALPSQVVSDKDGNIFFVEHGGNKIVKISSDNWMMTEFDIPTGPLATAVFLTVSEDGKRVWFTEWASNKIGYLDNTAGVPLEMNVRNNASDSKNPNLKYIVLKEGDTRSFNLSVTMNNKLTSLLLANDTQFSVVGMSDAGLQGIIYTLNLDNVNLTKVPEQDVTFEIKTEEENAIAGNYTIMLRASLLEKDSLIISSLYPQLVRLDVPTKASEINNLQDYPQFSSGDKSDSTTVLFRNLIRVTAISAAVILVGYLVYQKVIRKIKFKQT